MKKLTPSLYMLLGCISLILIISLFSSYIAPYDPYETNVKAMLLSPSKEHLLGTDGYGRDTLSRILVGSRTTIFVSLGIVVTVSMFGSIIGLVSGYYGGKVDALLMRLTDVLLAFPEMLLAVAVAGVLGGGLQNAVMALLAVSWTTYARLARSMVIALKEEPFMKAARMSGCSDSYLLFVHILPNIIGPLIVTATLHIGTMMISLSALSFLGLGVKVPAAEWGSMISEGRNYLQTSPWVVLFTSTTMVGVILLFNVLGDKVRDILDPKQYS